MADQYTDLTFKDYLKIQDRRPRRALKILQKRPEFAKSQVKNASKWIEGSTALHWAAHNGSLSVVKRLVKLGAAIDSSDADWWSRPIDWACDSAQYKVVKYLLKKGASLSGDKWSNCTPLHVLAQGGSSNGRKGRKKYIKTARYLLRNGSVINAIAKYGGQPPSMTPLDDALAVGNKMIADYLISEGGKKAADLKIH